MLAKRVLILLLVLLSGAAGGTLFGGVRQMRSVDSLPNSNTTNVGTNAYADLEANSNSTYATVNPNYSDRATVYHEENGSVAVSPRNAVRSADYGTASFNGYGAVVTGGYYHDYNSWAGSAAHGTMIPIGTIVEYVPSTAAPVMVSGSGYYYENNIYFAEVFDGSAVVYEVVPAPLGAVVTVLPAGCAIQYFNGKSFSVCGNIYYQQVAGGYQVVAVN